MEEAAFLVAVQRIIRGVEVEMISFGGALRASRKRSTNRRSIA